LASDRYAVEEQRFFVRGWWLLFRYPGLVLFTVLPLALLVCSHLPLFWFPLLGVYWLASGIKQWGRALGFPLSASSLLLRSTVVVIFLAVVLLLFGMRPLAHGGPVAGVTGRVLAMLLPILFFVPLTFCLFPGADGQHRWSEQLADAWRFLLCGSIHSPFGDHEGKIRVGWALLLAMCESIALLPWFLRHTILLYPLLALQIVLALWMFPMAWIFWAAMQGKVVA